MPNPILLYIEDDEAAVFLLKSTVRDLGSQIDFYDVSDGEAAMTFLRKTGVHQNAPTPNLILLDLNLPKMGGLQVLAKIFSDPLLASIPVVILTSSSLASDRRRSMALGAKEFIIKPSSLDSFIEVVKKTCSMIAE